VTSMIAASARAADVILPPTLLIDFLYLGFPMGIFAGIALLTALVLTYRHLRNRSRGRAFSAFIGALVFFAGNLAIYLFWLNFLRRSPSRDRDLEVPPPRPTTSSTTSTSSTGVDTTP
jgi:hypothetical protein